MGRLRRGIQVVGTVTTLRVVLCALTGFGNPVLTALLNDPRVNVEAVFTIKYENPFPHYEEQHLIEFCHQRGVTCYHGVKVSSEEGVALLRKHAPDLITVATFKQILKANVLRLPRLGVVNFHPSLLPRYRGACPTNAALANNEKITGVTVHYVTEGVDDGDMLLQRSVSIDEMDNDGLLRQKLARLAGEMVPGIVDMFCGINKPVGIPQDNTLATFAPKPTLQDGYIDLMQGIHAAHTKMRAFNPLPGTSVLLGEKRIAVDRFTLHFDDRPDGVYITGAAIDLVENGQAIRLYRSSVEAAQDVERLPIGGG